METTEPIDGGDALLSETESDQTSERRQKHNKYTVFQPLADHKTDIRSDDQSSGSGETFDIFRKKAQRQRVFELEQQLQIAESRCGTLKHQVEYMRMLYAGVGKQNEDKLPHNKESTDNVVPNLGLSMPKIKTKRTNTASGVMTEKKGAGKVSELKGQFEQSAKMGLDERFLGGMSRSNEVIPEVKPSRRVRRRRTDGTGCSVGTGEPDVRSEITQRQGRSMQLGSGYLLPTVKSEPLGLSDRESDLETETGQFKTDRPNGLEGRAPAGPSQHSPHPPDQDNALLNYQLPTVSSEMKRVPRCFLPAFNYRSIPFVVGMSTNKTHNLGLKIQETLSLIKMRNTIPFGPATKIWAMAGEEKQEFGEIYSGVPPNLGCTTNCGQLSTAEGHYRDSHKAFENNLKSNAFTRVPSRSLSPTMSSISGWPVLSDPRTQELLKNVLKHLHEEFSSLGRQYDKVKQTAVDKAPEVNGAEDKETIKQLEQSLGAKENEIKAILLLYKEVQNLRLQLEQMKCAGFRPAIGNCALNLLLKSFPGGGAKFVRKQRDKFASLKTTRLMRRIQQYQEKLQGLM